MNIFKLLALVFLFITMFVQDVLAKTAKKASPVKKLAKKAGKAVVKKAAKVVADDDD